MQLIIMLVFGIACAIIAQQKGRSAVGWFFIGFFFSLIGLIIVLVVSNKQAEQDKQEALLREQRRLREQLKQERMKNRAFQSHTKARLDAHDGALDMQTRDLAPAGKKAPLLREKESRAFVEAEPSAAGSADLDSGWYVYQEGQNRGPLARTELCRMHSYNDVSGDNLVWHPSMATWKALREMRHVLGIKGQA